MSIHHSYNLDTPGSFLEPNPKKYKITKGKIMDLTWKALPVSLCAHKTQVTIFLSLNSVNPNPHGKRITYTTKQEHLFLSYKILQAIFEIGSIFSNDNIKGEEYC